MHLTGFNHENSDLDQIQSKKSALDQIQPKKVPRLTTISPTKYALDHKYVLLDHLYSCELDRTPMKRHALCESGVRCA